MNAHIVAALLLGYGIILGYVEGRESGRQQGRVEERERNARSRRGEIREVFLFNRALSASEIHSLAQSLQD